MVKPIEEVKPEKLSTVKELREKFQKAQSVVFVDYRGLTVAEITDLRVRLRAEKVEMKVVKNRLAKLALNELGIKDADNYLLGPTGFVFGYEDPVPPAKILIKYVGENAKLQIKGGLVDKKAIDALTVDKLSKMASKPEMLSRMLGSLNSPITKVALGLKAAMNKLVYAVQAVADQKTEQQ